MDIATWRFYKLGQILIQTNTTFFLHSENWNVVKDVFYHVGSYEKKGQHNFIEQF